MRLRTFLFDLDGTLIDHLPAIHRCYSYTLPKLGYPAPTYDEVRRAIGGGLPTAMAKFVPAERVDEALAVYRPYWAETMLDGVSVLPGVGVLLRDLKSRGCRAAVFTNKHGPSARKLCDHLGLAPWLDDVVGAEDTAWLKPEPQFNDWMLDRIGATRDTTCLVGDSPYDVAAARAGGWTFYGVTTGTHSAAELRDAGADNVQPDLPSWMREWGFAGSAQ